MLVWQALFAFPSIQPTSLMLKCKKRAMMRYQLNQPLRKLPIKELIFGQQPSDGEGKTAA